MSQNIYSTSTPEKRNGGEIIRTEGRRNHPYGARPGAHPNILTLHKRIERPTTAAVDYESLTRDELRALAKERGLIGYSKLSKADLVSTLVLA